MKQIQSAGGPLIGLDRDHLHLWSGVFGKKFIGDTSPFRTDYEAAGYLTNGRAYPPCNISKIIGVEAHGILITGSEWTSVLNIDLDGIYIAQIEYCEPEWNLDCINRGDFDRAIFDRKEDVFFSCKSCTYVLFDAAYEGPDVGDDCLTFSLDAGEYLFSTAMCKPCDKTGLVLCKITKKSDADTSIPLG